MNVEVRHLSRAFGSVLAVNDFLASCYLENAKILLFSRNSADKRLVYTIEHLVRVKYLLYLVIGDVRTAAKGRKYDKPRVYLIL